MATIGSFGFMTWLMRSIYIKLGNLFSILLSSIDYKYTISFYPFMEDQKKGYIYALVAVGLWSTVATAFKLALKGVEPIHLLFFASTSSLAVLFILILVRGKCHLLFSITRRQLLMSAILGFLNPFLYYLVLFHAYDILPAQEAQPLNYTWPLTLAIFSIIILKQKIGVTDFMAIGISFLGVLVIATRGDIFAMQFSDPFGVSLAVGSSIIWALYWVFNMKDGRDPVVKLFMNFFFGTIFALVLYMVMGGNGVTASSPMLLLVYVGVFEMGLTFVVWLKALALSRTTAKIGNLIFFSPFLSLVFIQFVLGENISSSTFVGLGFIVGGVLFQKYFSHKKPKRYGNDKLDL